jgi:predicted nuclease of predicted toxin-antitoxin system
MKILVDHNIEGYAVLLWGTLLAEGWLELVTIDLINFVDVGLAFNNSDRTVWRFAQANGMVLLTDNRNMVGVDSLEQTLREENTGESLPIITIGNLNRLDEKEYRQQCVSRLVDVALTLNNYLGTARIFIP